MATTTTKKKMLRRMRTAVRRCVSVNVLCQGCGGACFLGSAGLVVTEGATDAAPYLRGKMNTDQSAPHVPDKAPPRRWSTWSLGAQNRGSVVEQIVSIAPGSRRFLSGDFWDPARAHLSELVADSRWIVDAPEIDDIFRLHLRPGGREPEEVAQVYFIRAGESDAVNVGF